MTLTNAVALYLSAQRAAGRRMRTETGTLRAYCRAMGAVDLTAVDPAAVATFLAGQGPLTLWWRQKWAVLRSFYRFASARGWVTTTPLPATLPRNFPTFTPYVYSVPDLHHLLAATAQLHTPMSPLQAETMRTLLLLLYGTGLRIREALDLRLLDVDLGEALLTVRDTKFYKRRWVPVGPKLTHALATYARQRRQLPLPAGDVSAFFATRMGHPLSYDRANQLFRRLRHLAGVRREASARYQPRLHDLRHTSAVHRVTCWYQSGADVPRLLPALATYLGHVGLRSTQRYLTLTPEWLTAANQRFEAYAHPEVSND